ncbi:MAG: VWA domain-containing protein [Thaumarchaeota archaeon]|nr:VWA domain-containing protein [Nitrososphaerota archaeon]
MNPEKNSDFLGYAYDLVATFAKKKPEEIDLTFSRKISFPMITRVPPNPVTLPLPRFKNGQFFFEGFVFEDDPEQRYGMWSLFLASAYHLAAHVAASDYAIYKRWARNKTEELCVRIMDYIEDIFVDRYMITENREIWENLEKIREVIEVSGYLKTRDISWKDRSLGFKMREAEALEKIRNSLITMGRDEDSHKGILGVADSLYKNRHLLPKFFLPYHDRSMPCDQASYRKFDLDFKVDDQFRETAYRLEELWSVNEQSRMRLLKQYSKHMKDLHFDSVMLAPENYFEFARIRESLSPMIRRIRQQIRMVVNVTDSPKNDQAGYLDMQMAIQSIASKKNSYDVFEMVEERRAEEAWIILIDKSASMRLRFDHIKEFAVCVAEAANELAGGPEAWAMYSFDNNFQILKGFGEKYGRQVQARLGGLQNSGLSLLPDALDLSCRALLSDPREKKFLFVITDGHPSGYERINEQFSKMAKKVDMSGIILVAIGVSKATSKRFRNSVRGNDLKQLVAKFITAYRTASSDM